jgi:hypothetical protein
LACRDSSLFWDDKKAAMNCRTPKATHPVTCSFSLEMICFLAEDALSSTINPHPTTMAQE